MTAHIRISPFSAIEWDKLTGQQGHENRSAIIEPEFWLDNARDIRLLNSGRQAIYFSLKHLRLKPADEVLIVKTTPGPYISSCVTKTIESVCQWSRKLSLKTRAVLAIHEFGFPCPQETIEPYRQEGLPIIEDGAYSIGTRLEGESVGTFGDYAIYSLPKYYPIPFGGILASKKPLGAVKEVSAHDQALIKTTLINSLLYCYGWNEIRRSNWNFFAEKLKKQGIVPYFPLSEKIIPGVFLMKATKNFRGSIRKQNLIKAGVEATEYYGQSGFYFPVHQFLTSYEKNYILHHFNKTS